MLRSSRLITLVLLPSCLLVLELVLYSCDNNYSYSSTQPYSHSYGHSSFGRSFSSGSRSSSFSSHTSRGGFGSTGHSVSS